jgi:hypothetical protein
MSNYFKPLGNVDTSMALAQFYTVIENMIDKNIDQYGLNGRLTADQKLDFGEGKTKMYVKLEDWNHWRDKSYNQGWLQSLLIELAPRTIGRIRVMRIRPKRCYSWHSDLTPRIHVPLITSTNNFMIINNESMHLHKGVYWWTDTRKFHTALNCSEKDRFHLVIEVSE